MFLKKPSLENNTSKDLTSFRIQDNDTQSTTFSLRALLISQLSSAQVLYRDALFVNHEPQTVNNEQ